jgi:hypothetical protein
VVGERRLDLSHAGWRGFETIARNDNQIREDIRPTEQQVGDLGLDCYPPSSNARKYGFKSVREADEAVEAEAGGTTLYGMDGTENRIDDLPASLTALERQKSGLELRQEFFALLEEDSPDRLQNIRW